MSICEFPLPASTNVRYFKMFQTILGKKVKHFLCRQTVVAHILFMKY